MDGSSHGFDRHAVTDIQYLLAPSARLGAGAHPRRHRGRRRAHRRYHSEIARRSDPQQADKARLLARGLALKSTAFAARMVGRAEEEIALREAVLLTAA